MLDYQRVCPRTWQWHSEVTSVNVLLVMLADVGVYDLQPVWLEMNLGGQVI